jgi:hypothetical protein
MAEYSREQIIRIMKRMQGNGTASDLAAQLGVHQTYICQIFRGRELTDTILNRLDPPLERKTIYVTRRRKRGANG